MSPRKNGTRMNIEFVDKYGMLPAGARVLCAVSGGADSMCLLHWLRSFSAERGLFVACAHYNHGLRGAESDRDAQFVASYCRENGIDYRVGQGDAAGYASARRLGIEEAARELRYAFLEQAAAELDCERIATAHNADDNAETMLLNLARGTGLRGLGGIPPRRGKIVRPLLMTPRREIEKYLQANAIPHVEDSTNASNIYTRNRLRHHVTPAFCDINPAFFEAVGRTAELLREDEQFLDALAREFVDRHGQKNALPVQELLALPGPVSTRALRVMAGTELSRTHVEALLRLCGAGNPSAAVDIPGMRVRREYDWLTFASPEPTRIPEQVIRPGETLRLEAAGWTVRCALVEHYVQVHKSFNIFFFQYETVCGNISVRSRLPGDQIRISGRNCTKSLKKLFAEARIPAQERDRIPVLADEQGVIAVAGFGTAERCAAIPGGRAICIEVHQTER
jgi:tRNA(Ile)-lysidine synthase